MKRLILICLLINTYTLFSQKSISGEVNGYVLDKKDKIAIPYATVTCKTDKEKIITGGITDKKGKFSLKKIPLGTYLIEIQFIGYTSITQAITLTSKENKINLSPIFLEENNTSLNTVEIDSEVTSVVQKVDKKIINVGKDLIATGSNSLQLLQNIPSVDVNLQTGSISLRGNENVRVLINGKPSNMNTAQLLRQTPSALIKQIEIITTPSAKYNPEGMSGIINFILRKNTDYGFNGNVFFGTEHSKNTRPSGTLDFNYNTGKTNYFGNYSISFGKSATLQRLSREDKVLNQHFDFLHNYTDQAFKVGSDFHLNSKSTLSLYTYQNYSSSTLYTNTTVQSDTNSLYTPNLSDYNESEQIYNVDYKLDLDDNGGNLELEANYSIHKNPETSINRFPDDENNKQLNYTNAITDTRKSWLVNLDYEKVIFNDYNLEVGLEYRSQKMHSTIVTDQEIEVGSPPTVQPKGNTEFNYDRYMYSGYFNIHKTFNKLSLQTGIRFEQFLVEGLFSNTQQSAKMPYSDKIFSVYPSLFITYNINEKEDIQIAYSKRVDRPSMFQVTPIQEWVSPLTISEGNQTLVPQFTNSVELNYSKSFSKGSVTFGTFYRIITDKIGRIIQQNASNPDKQIISYNNYDSANSYGVEISASYNAYSWWKIAPRIETYIQDSQGIVNQKEERIKNTLFKTTVNNRFKISKRLRAQLTAIHKGTSKNVQFEVKPYTMINIGASLSVLDGKGTVTFRGTDIFNGLNYDYSSESPFPQVGHYDLEYDTVFLGFSYNFGSSKNKSRTRKYRDENESSGGLF
ncbi:TonB-dependent receptor domain-containing protein [Tenacibaculum sp. TC6]|uniref:TonB-dependent receptor domain-containing protein n=1 Tax=Tenacibaculum sp. TC6 TaxID=3423223 RepID=UPI003D359FAA